MVGSVNKKYFLVAMSCMLFLLVGFAAYDMFFTINVQDIHGGGNIMGSSPSNVSFTIVNNMFYEKQLTYKWELDDAKAGQPSSNEFTGSGSITLPARSSCRIISFAPPPRYITNSGEVHYFEGEGTYLDIKIFDGDRCIFHTPSW